MKRKPRKISLEPLEAKLNDYSLKIGEGKSGSWAIALTKEELERIYILIINETSAYVMVE